VVRRVRKHPQELGCIREDELLGGELDYQDFVRLPAEDEAITALTARSSSKTTRDAPPASGSICN